MNATPSSRESKINQQKLDLYVESIIEATASSLQDVVLRVSSSTKQLDKIFDNGSQSSLNVCGILTSSYSEVTPSESLTAVCEPEEGTLTAVPVQESSDPPVDQPPQSPSSPQPRAKHIKSHRFKWPRKSSAVRATTEDIEKVPIQESSDPPVDQPPQSPSSPQSRGKHIKSHQFKWPQKSSAVRATTEDIEKEPVQESSDPPVYQPPQSPSSPEPTKKNNKSRRFKWRRKSSAVRATTEDIGKDSQVGVHRITFEESHPSCEEYLGFFTKSDHCDQSGNDVFLLNTGKLPVVSKLFQRSESKRLADNLCSNVEEFVRKNLVTDKFTVIIHGEDDGTKLCSLYLAKKFYRLLKTRFFEGLNFCIILKAKLSLKAVFKLAKPFIPNNVKQKISMVNDVGELVVFHGIPETLLQYTC
nr:uncharacterized protein LOC131792111 isoform X1 [Pocillopora verrucosa]